MKPTTIESFSDRLPTLRAERNKRVAEIQPLKNECAEIRPRLQNGGTPKLGNEDEVRLSVLMGKEPPPLVLPDRERLNAILVKLNNLNAEIGVFDAEILKEAQLANKKFIESQRDEIVSRGNKFAKALVDLCAADLEYEQYLDFLEDSGGATVGQFRIRLSGLGSPRDLSSGYAYGLREFVDAGMMHKSSLPKAFKQ